MKRRLTTLHLWVAVLTLALVLDQLGASPLYRWVDDQGEVHYTDRLPPDQAIKERARLSEQGLVIESNPKPPSPQEQERAQEEEQRRAEEERRKAERLAEDRRLLNYRSLEEIDLARDGQIAIIEAVIQSKRDQIRAITRNLFKLNRQRTAPESANNPMTQEFSGQLEIEIGHLRSLYSEILDEEQRKLQIWEGFARKRARYLELKKQTVPDPSPFAEELPMVDCQEALQCHTYWRRALDYIRSPLAGDSELQEFNAPGLVILMQRTKEEERIIHLVWIQQSTDQPVWIYLDLQCRNRQTGRLTCDDPAIARMRPGFRSAVEQGL